MDLFLKIAERALTSILLSVLMMLASFSYFTGKFPPRKDDIFKAFRLSQQMFAGAQDLKNSAQAIQEAQARGGPPNLEQIVEFQRMALKKTELTVELTKIFKRFQVAPPNLEAAEKLQKITDHLAEAERDMAEISASLQNAMGANDPSAATDVAPQ